jgi:hypothetical protein
MSNKSSDHVRRATYDKVENFDDIEQWDIVFINNEVKDYFAKQYVTPYLFYKMSDEDAKLFVIEATKLQGIRMACLTFREYMIERYDYGMVRSVEEVKTITPIRSRKEKQPAHRRKSNLKVSTTNVISSSSTEQVQSIDQPGSPERSATDEEVTEVRTPLRTLKTSTRESVVERKEDHSSVVTATSSNEVTVTSLKNRFVTKLPKFDNFRNTIDFLEELTFFMKKERVRPFETYPVLLLCVSNLHLEMLERMENELINKP